MWSRFIIDYGLGETIDPDTYAKFNAPKDWESKSKNFTLNCEFFKAMGQLEERDLEVLAQHLLNKTRGRNQPFLKVFVKKPTINY